MRRGLIVIRTLGLLEDVSLSYDEGESWNSLEVFVRTGNKVVDSEFVWENLISTKTAHRINNVDYLGESFFSEDK